LRRKQGPICLNPANLNHIVSTVNCNCTELDYECDFGYELGQFSSKCVPMPDYPPSAPSSCPPGTSYLQSQGYRKVPSDTCVNELAQFAPVSVVCPAAPSSGSVSSSSGSVPSGSPLPTGLIVAIVIAAVAVVALLLFLGILIGSRFQRFRQLVPWSAKGPFATTDYSNQLQMIDDDAEVTVEK